MAAKDNEKAAGSAGASTADRTAKAQATRRINSQRYDKLSAANQYAYDKVRSLILTLDRFAGHLLDGGTATGELVAQCSELEKQVGSSFFK